jgi:hypothetical protein
MGPETARVEVPLPRSRRRSAPALLVGAAALVTQLTGAPIFAGDQVAGDLSRTTALTPAGASPPESSSTAADAMSAGAMPAVESLRPAALSARPWPPPRSYATQAETPERPWPPPRPIAEDPRSDPHPGDLPRSASVTEARRG